VRALGNRETTFDERNTMSEPTTLRAISGLPAAPPSLAESTLIMIDCQNTYTRGVMELAGVDAALDQAAELLDRARSAGIPIIHIQHDAGAGSPYDVRAEIGAIVDRVAPRAGEPVVVKNFPDSFVQTDLDGRLKAGSAHNLLLAGFMTHMCVNSTARGAFNLGYAPTVVAAATATRALPAPGGGTVAAAALQAASLAAVADLFGVVVPDAKDVPD
jgi:nicotinamidase-related amidase